MTRATLIGRREWIANAIGVGAIGAGAVARAASGVFEAIEVNHVALRVEDLATSEDFYRRVFGAPGIIFERPGQRYLRMRRNFVALFEREPPAMDHFAISISDYDADAVQHQTETLGLRPRRSSSFVYVLDPDGIEVQIAHAEHEVHSPVVREPPETASPSKATRPTGRWGGRRGRDSIHGGPEIGSTSTTRMVSKSRSRPARSSPSLVGPGRAPSPAGHARPWRGRCRPLRAAAPA